MKDFWCADQRYYDSGRVKVIVYRVEAEQKPKSGMVENNLCDQRRDYFDTYDEAYAFSKTVERL